MSIKVQANAEVRRDFHPFTGGAGTLPPLRTDHANDETPPMVLALPASVRVQANRLGLDGRESAVLANEDDITLLFTTEGEARVHVDGTAVGLTRLRAVVAGGIACRVEGSAGVPAMALRLPRTAVQICASASHGGARRMARDLLPLDLGRAGGLRGLLGDLNCHGVAEGQSRALLEAVVAALAAQHGADVAFPASRSITLVRGWLDRSVAVPLPVDLARKAGVTGITLQRGFKAILGTTVARYSQAVRLHGARARLECGWECRTIAEIAQDTGFPSATTFTRAYQKLFSETPTQTRTRIFRREVSDT